MEHFKVLEENGAVVNMERLDEYWYFVCERQNIYWRRVIEKKPAPWTDDEILANYRFCNIERTNDRNTILMIDEILSQGGEDEYLKKNVLFNIFIFRVLNRYETFKEHGFLWMDKIDFEKDFADKLRAMRDRGESVFTSAHMLNNPHYFNPDPKTKRDKLHNFLLIFKYWYDNWDEIYEKFMACKSMEEQHEYLKSLPGLGSFLAYEICNSAAMAGMFYDYKLTPWDDNGLGKDGLPWANPGPGCQRGIDFIFEKRGKMRYIDILRWFHKYQHEELKRTGNVFRHTYGNELSMLSVENSFCEVFKYFKAKYGLGRPRNKFKPITKDVNYLKPRTKQVTIQEYKQEA